VTTDAQSGYAVVTIGKRNEFSYCNRYGKNGAYAMREKGHKLNFGSFIASRNTRQVEQRRSL